jgi:DNA helicase-2/ATP-dependent DNA helicase PcrA
MALTEVETAPANHDDHVDLTISKCMDPDNLKSFFLYAGAGSGKTRSLVTALETFSQNHGSRFYKNGHQIAVITYTNAACDEITERVASHSKNGETLFRICTIHSFCWLLIQNFHSNIREYLLEEIPTEITEISEKERKGRASKASLDRQRKIKSLKERLEWLSVSRKFTYNPNGNDFGQASLSHSEVLKITANFILNKPIMKAIIVKKFPYVLIDESQDTNKDLIDAFFHLEEEKKGEFALGLLGDQMQRIYLDGKERLADSIPERWVKPEKELNHRCPQRIIQLSNSLRSIADGQCQKARDDSDQGLVRIFIAPTNTQDKHELEKKIMHEMKKMTGDELWVTGGNYVKSLTLEHHMAAKRMGFLELFTALDGHSSLTTGLRDGSLPGLRFFSEVIEPVVQAYNAHNRFELMALCRKHSLLLKQDAIASRMNNESEALEDPLRDIREAIDDLVYCVNNENATFEDVLKTVDKTDVFPIPNSLRPFIVDLKAESIDNNDEEDDEKTSLTAWRDFLESPYKQIQPYARYIGDTGEFDTHQGVKGREFDRVFVVIDDNEARGFLFSYEKLLGAKPASASDTKNISEGKESSQDRTLRLLYVTCTRAEKSLALVVYSENPKSLKNHVIDQGWFLESEVVELP